MFTTVLQHCRTLLTLVERQALCSTDTPRSSAGLSLRSEQYSSESLSICGRQCSALASHARVRERRRMFTTVLQHRRTLLTLVE